MGEIVSSIFFTSDTHFGHTNIIKYSNRPFSCVEEMDEVLIENINKTVKRNDTLYHLGDWSFRNPESYKQRIHCRFVHLIWGNHDKQNRKDKSFISSLSGTYDLIRIKTEPNVTLCHYAMKTWDRAHYGTYHLYGHSHGTLRDDPNSLSFDVGVDCMGYLPISFDEVKTIMDKKTFIPIDHHTER